MSALVCFLSDCRQPLPAVCTLVDHFMMFLAKSHRKPVGFRFLPSTLAEDNMMRFQISLFLVIVIYKQSSVLRLLCASGGKTLDDL